MKKIILILLCLPLFAFSQEERQYTKTMSVSQFAKELKQAAESGSDYSLEDYKITYNPIKDKQYVIDNLNIPKFEGDALIKDLQFSDSSVVSIKNCQFGDVKELPRGYQTTLQFFNCSFGEIRIMNVNVGGIYVDSISAKKAYFTCDKEDKEFNIEPFSITITHSRIIELAANSHIKSIKSGNIFNSKPVIDIWKNIIRNTRVSGFNRLSFSDNKCHSLLVGGIYTTDHQINTGYIQNNTFSGEINSERLSIYKHNLWKAHNYNGIYVSNIKMQKLAINKNQFDPVQEFMIKDFDKLESQILNVISWDGYIDTRYNKDTLRIQEEVYNDNWDNQKKINFLKDYFNKNSIKVKPTGTSQLFFNSSKIDEFSMGYNSVPRILFRWNTFYKGFSAQENNIDSLIQFKNNKLPTSYGVEIDSSFFRKMGASYAFIDTTTGDNYWVFKTIYGNEEYSNINSEKIKTTLSSLIKTYKQWILLLQNNGNQLSNNLAIKLKDLQSNIKMFEYYENPNMESWFNWKGSEFLKWYSDYGTNPFKALSYCFKAMFFFALFYFIFYNDWDKIDRGFLINRFNSVMDYFTTEKRIEDFYSSTHDKEMSTFTEFQGTLEKNKVYMPKMLVSLAKPIYQISLMRYKLLNFSYKKIEFMAGRKWVDLQKKERYWIGALTFFLTLTYIIYLILTRALNSLIISINAFSTLGFGQIPVKGYVKYVAIIEGFIGWFMLSIFLVSILNQMMNT